MLERLIEIGNLFDFYGELLTVKQQEVIYLYCYEDLSLGEIAEKLDISRQGVYDHLHRGEEILRNYEKRLGLFTKYSRLKDEIDSLAKYISKKDIDKQVKKELEERLKEIKNNL